MGIEEQVSAEEVKEEKTEETSEPTEETPVDNVEPSTETSEPETDWGKIFANLYNEDDQEEENDQVETNDEQVEETAVQTENEETPDEVQTTGEVAEPIPDDVQKQLDDILSELHSLNPSIQKFSDLEDVELFAAFIDRGYKVEDALIQSSPKYRETIEKKDGAYVKAQSKAHLTATASDRYAADIDTDVIAICMNAGMTKEAAIEYYKRVTKK